MPLPTPTRRPRPALGIPRGGTGGAQRGLRLAVALGLGLAASGAWAGDRVALPPQPAGVAWPSERWPRAEPAPDVDAAALAAAVEASFAARGRGGLPDTRALLVIRGGRLVFERYAEGFDAGSRFQSWSMAKSVTGILAGIAVRDGLLQLDAPAPVPEWSAEGDPRGEITLRQLLQMTSGLDNADGHEGAGSNVGKLLFGEWSGDMARHAAAFPLIHPPGTHWAYSTATSTLIAALIGAAVGDGPEDTLAFMRRELLEPLGAASVLAEFDAAGTFQGGSSVWATARDWARLGLLLLRDGVWDGRRVLPEGWVDFARTPTAAANNGTFGAHLWLNLSPAEDQFVALPGGPESEFQMSGNAGQYVALLPSRDLIIVRLGEMHSVDWAGVSAPLAALAAAFPDLPTASGGR